MSVFSKKFLPVTVIRIKSMAKEIVKNSESLSYCQALELVVKEFGYKSYASYLACAKNDDFCCSNCVPF